MESPPQQEPTPASMFPPNPLHWFCIYLFLNGNKCYGEWGEETYDISDLCYAQVIDFLALALGPWAN